MKTIFDIEYLQISETGMECRVNINANHEIFKGHFPDRPILPGVIMLQIITRAAEKYTGEKLQLKRVIQAKFLQFIDPLVHPAINCKLTLKEQENGLHLSAVLEQEEIVFSKIQMSFEIRTT
ncbi:MAG TPA: hypothetical protein PK076_03215 [Saprospiraceae bacterium]|nr:hypothetical protein [Saprospiraceae bacterium]HQW55103.1 hypothetical protein [Saprospiraceae bacterium]